MKCVHCNSNRPAIKRPRTGDAVCKNCFIQLFEEEVYQTIIGNELFRPQQKIGICVSGGKDSTVLAETLTTLNNRYNMGLDLYLLSIDEGIKGYRDGSLETVKQNQLDYKIPLKILSFKDIYGWSMDEIVKAIGSKNNCTFCGVFRRGAMDRGASILHLDCLVTGHNADDVAETILMNVLRGDVARLGRCTEIITGEYNSDLGLTPRCKPFKYMYEKEIVMYARFKRLLYFTTECLYSPEAYRGHARMLIKEMERMNPAAIIDIIHSGEQVHFDHRVPMPVQGKCTECGHVSSSRVCKACTLLKGLNSGRPKAVINLSLEPHSVA
eukprot:GCRY01002705.1.p1 GENE.GCRY01002705.1~~GCRY01002705.1.p1  ORF type:complete len:325 (+),score=-1.52 GCRY01002705.1:167-1141(+)